MGVWDASEQSRCSSFCLITGVSHIILFPRTIIAKNTIDLVQPPCLQMRIWNSRKVK